MTLSPERQKSDPKPLKETHVVSSGVVGGFLCLEYFGNKQIQFIRSFLRGTRCVCFIFFGHFSNHRSDNVPTDEF